MSPFGTESKRLRMDAEVLLSKGIPMPPETKSAPNDAVRLQHMLATVELIVKDLGNMPYPSADDMARTYFQQTRNHAFTLLMQFRRLVRYKSDGEAGTEPLPRDVMREFAEAETKARHEGLVTNPINSRLAWLEKILDDFGAWGSELTCRILTLERLANLPARF